MVHTHVAASTAGDSGDARWRGRTSHRTCSCITCAARRPGALGRLLATLRSLNPGASIAGAAKGLASDLPPADDAEPEALPDLPDATARPPIFPTRLAIKQTVDWTAFAVWLSALLHARGDDVLRVKGVVRTPAGRLLLLQSVRKVVQSPEILPDQPDEGGREDNTIVVIGRGYRADDLRRSLAHFAGSRS
jgi:G3E family GTPase